MSDPPITDTAATAFRTRLRAEPIAVSPKTAQEMLSIGKTKLFELIKDGTLNSKKIGKSRRITVASIKRAAGAGDG